MHHLDDKAEGKNYTALQRAEEVIDIEANTSVNKEAEEITLNTSHKK